MKKSLLFLLLFGLNTIVAQVKVGENPSVIDATSILELESTSRVLVITRVTTLEMEAMRPLQGAMVFNEDESCIFYFDGTNWNNLCAGGNGGSNTWGGILGNLSDQTDLVTEFAKYVDLTNVQSVAGEKTFTDKFTVSTGDVTAQAAEFLGRVKGENGTAPEDFVTKGQLDASGGGNIAWGSITGTLTAQIDLATEFANYVDLTSIQSVAGEKTFTSKLTVNTGSPSDQIAEFLGRVKGENGAAPEDFVTKSQLDGVTAGGHVGLTGSIFFAGPTNDPIENNTQLFWDNTNNRLGIGTNTPNSLLQINGAMSAPITFIGGSILLDESNHTIFINGDTFVGMPDPMTCPGRIYYLKKKPVDTVTISFGYSDTNSNLTTTMSENVVQLQSNGFIWEQIN